MIKKQAKKVVESAQTGISRGLGLSVLTQGGKFIGDTIRGFFNIPKIEQKETFSQAMSRMKLTEADLSKQISRYWQQFWIFVTFSFIALGYALYAFMGGGIATGLVTILAATLLFAYALRAHFWIFQIKNRKLGCTWQEWWDNKINSQEENKIVKK